MYTTLKLLGKRCHSNKFDERLFSDIYLYRLRLKKGTEIHDFYILRQEVPEGRSSEGYASFKQVKPWHVEVIPGVGVVGLVTKKELCQVIWGIIIKNFMHQYSFIVSELLR